MMRWTLALNALFFVAGLNGSIFAAKPQTNEDRRLDRYHQMANTPPGALREALSVWRSDFRTSKRLSGHPVLPQLAKVEGISLPMQRAPYQDPDRAYFTGAPVALANGTVLFLWATDDTLFCSLSVDSARTWGPRIVATLASSYIYEVTAIQKSDESVMAMLEVNTGIEWTASTDNGASWATPALIPGTTGFELEPNIMQATDNTLHVAYYTGGSTSWDIAFRRSTDGGTTWGPQRILASTSEDEFAPAFVSGEGTTLVALYMSNNGTDFDILKRASTDGGSTWGSATPVLNTPLSEYRPRVARQADGTLHLVFITDQASPVFANLLWWELYSSTSTDGGSSWSSPARFTHYVADDGIQNITLLNDQPLVLFQSTRWQPNLFFPQLWYGIVGTTVDSEAPPVVYPFFGTQGVISATPPSYVALGVDDDNGVSAVSLEYRLKGGSPSSTPMFDDGAHGDGAASDGIWGAEIGGLQAVDTVQFWATATDVDNNTIASDLDATYKTTLAMPAHTVGAMTLCTQPNGALGGQNGFTGNGIGFNASYGGSDYLYSGGLWVGSRVTRFLQKRVSGPINAFEPGDWRPTLDEPISIGPGRSDQDISLSYNDSSAGAPLGLSVSQTSYQWAAPGRDDFVILTYAITNTGRNGDLGEVYAALNLDPDVSLQTISSDDLAGYDVTRGLLYMYDSQMNPTGYIGIRWLDGPSPFAVNAYTGNLSTDVSKYDAMTANNPPTGSAPDDYRILMTAPAFALDSAATKTVAFGIVMGESLENLQENADTMKAIYDGTVVSVRAEGQGPGELPAEYALDQNYPNPFNPSTTIRFALPEAAPVRLELYNGIGQRVRLLLEGERAAGVHSVRLDAAELPTGVYFYRLSAGRFTDTKKLMLVK